MIAKKRWHNGMCICWVVSTDVAQHFSLRKILQPESKLAEVLQCQRISLAAPLSLCAAQLLPNKNVHICGIRCGFVGLTVRDLC